MSTVRIVNENQYTYKEHFMGDEIEIKPGGWVEMDEKKANMFMGTFAPIKKDAQGRPDPKYFKKLKVVPLGVTAQAKAVEPEQFVCQFDGSTHESKEALDAYINENHLDKLTDQKVADERRKKKS